MMTELHFSHFPYEEYNHQYLFLISLILIKMSVENIPAFIDIMFPQKAQAFLSA
jgi:hypothetical protein